MVTYNPEPWDSWEHKRFNNCYNYALNLIDDTYLQPGYLAKRQGKSAHPMRRGDGYDFACLLANVLLDGCELWDGDEIPDGYHLVFLAYGDDYHWYRLDSDGRWSHKLGPASVEKLPAGADPFTDAKTYDSYWECGGYLLAPDKIE